MSSHVRVLALLVSMLLCCGCLAVLCGFVGHLHGMHTVAFMAAEVRNFQFLYSFTSVKFIPLDIKYYLCLFSSVYLLQCGLDMLLRGKPVWSIQYEHAIYAVSFVGCETGAV